MMNDEASLPPSFNAPILFIRISLPFPRLIYQKRKLSSTKRVPSIQSSSSTRNRTARRFAPRWARCSGGLPCQRFGEFVFYSACERLALSRSFFFAITHEGINYILSKLCAKSSFLHPGRALMPAHFLFVFTERWPSLSPPPSCFFSRTSRINGEFIGGCNDGPAKYGGINNLNSQNKLDGMLKSAGAI